MNKQRITKILGVHFSTPAHRLLILWGDAYEFQEGLLIFLIYLKNPD